MRKSVTTVLLLLSVLFTTSIAQAEPAANTKAITPKAAVTYGAMLDETSGNLRERVTIVYTISQTTFYTVVLQQNVNGSWRNYETSFSGFQTGSVVNYSHTVNPNPPRGYNYRLKVSASSTDFPNGLTFYSSQYYY